MEGVMTPKEVRGERHEERFLNLASRTMWRTPYWYLGVAQAEPELDLQGIDAIAWILLSDDKTRSPVPIQVKSSLAAVEAFRRTHADIVEAGAIVFLIHDRDRDEALLRRYYTLLERSRSQKATVAKNLLSRLRHHAVDGMAAFFEDSIQLRRREYAAL